MSAKVPQAALKPCDVLLMQGTSFISDLIRLIDQGRYSHAAIFDGNNVVEMLSEGTTVRPLSESVADTRFVDVYRYVGDNGQLLGGDPGLDPKPVLDRIQFYESDPERYGYEQIVLLALLCSTRTEAQKNLPPLLAMMLRQILDSAADELAKMIHENKTPMICSELVYECFAEAVPPYAIHVARIRHGQDANRRTCGLSRGGDCARRGCVQARSCRVLAQLRHRKEPQP